MTVAERPRRWWSPSQRAFISEDGIELVPPAPASPSDEAIDRAARAAQSAFGRGWSWDELEDDSRDDWRRVARAVAVELARDGEGGGTRLMSDEMPDEPISKAAYRAWIKAYRRRCLWIGVRSLFDLNGRQTMRDIRAIETERLIVLCSYLEERGRG